MKEVSIKKYSYGDKIYRFNFVAFKKAFTKKKEKSELSIGELEEEIAEEINVSSSTIHTWRNNKSAPCSLELVKELTQYFDLENYFELLIEEREEKNMQFDYELEMKKAEAIKTIYENIFEFLTEYKNTDAFKVLSYDVSGVPEELKKEVLVETMSVNISQESIDEYFCEIDNKLFEIKLMFKKESVPLLGTEIYYVLKEFLYNEISNFVYSSIEYWSNSNNLFKDYYEIVEKLQKIIDEKEIM